MFRSSTRLLSKLGKWFSGSRRPEPRSKTASFRPTLENLETREVMTTSGWVAGLPPTHMSFATQTKVTLAADTASKSIASLTVKDNVTRAVVFTAPTSGDYVIGTSKAPGHSSFDSVLGVYDSQGNRLAFDNDAPGTKFASLHVNLVAGHKYEIGVGHVRSTAKGDALSRFCTLTIDGPDRVAPPAVNLGQNLVDWVHARLGQTVGNGECAGLVDTALTAIGAKSFAQLGPVGDNADYVWGTQLFEFHKGNSLSLFDQLKPGDIIQYRDVLLHHDDANGGWSEVTMTHHTAIVEANLGGGNLRILEQNANAVRSVTESTLSFTDMKSGTIWVYRPIKA